MIITLLLSRAMRTVTSIHKSQGRDFPIVSLASTEYNIKISIQSVQEVPTRSRVLSCIIF